MAGTTLTPVYAALSGWEPNLGQPQPKKPTKARGAETKNPGPSSLGRGLLVEPMVEEDRTLRKPHRARATAELGVAGRC